MVFSPDYEYAVSIFKRETFALAVQVNPRVSRRVPCGNEGSSSITLRDKAGRRVSQFELLFICVRYFFPKN